MSKTPDHEAYVAEHGASMIFDHYSLAQVLDAMLARYPACYNFTLDFEGGYVNDPDDPGGCTNMGITIGTLQAWRGPSVTVTCEDVQNLSEAEAFLIYAQNYWAPVMGSDLSVGLNLQVWDWGVNSGPSRAIRYLQGMVGVAEDGVMGPDTLAASEKFVEKEGIEIAIDWYGAIRQDYYQSLDGFGKYGDGWTRRNNECMAEGKHLAQTQPKPLPPRSKGSVKSLEARIAELERWRES
jgi:lysozyme family protein